LRADEVNIGVAFRPGGESDLPPVRRPARGSGHGPAEGGQLDRIRAVGVGELLWWQHLDGHEAVEMRVTGFVHHARVALAELLNNLVMGDEFTGRAAARLGYKRTPAQDFSPRRKGKHPFNFAGFA
jgi:hypothetical protein